MTTKRTKDKRISPADWKRVEPAINHFAKVSLDIAYAVLVEGKKQTDAAVQFDRSKQAVGNAVNGVGDTIDTMLDNRLEHVEVWLPPELAEQVRKMAEDYHSSQGN